MPTSAGRRKDGDGRAGYVILDLSNDRPEVEFVQVEYDIDAVCEGIRKMVYTVGHLYGAATDWRAAAPRAPVKALNDRATVDQLK